MVRVNLHFYETVSPAMIAHDEVMIKQAVIIKYFIF